jgi:SAM-dependent methyltransferase
MLSAIGAVTPAGAATRILNMGAGGGDPLLTNLALLGYRGLYAIDLDAAMLWDTAGVENSAQDLQQTQFPAAHFGAIASVSVIEHNVRWRRYLREANRLLSVGGVLLTTTDYWRDKVDTGGVLTFGMPWNIFSRHELEEMLSRAVLDECGFELAQRDRADL